MVNGAVPQFSFREGADGPPLGRYRPGKGEGAAQFCTLSLVQSAYVGRRSAVSASASVR